MANWQMAIIPGIVIGRQRQMIKPQSSKIKVGSPDVQRQYRHNILCKTQRLIR